MESSTSASSGGRGGGVEVEGGEEVAGELPPREEDGQGRDEPHAVGDRQEAPGEPSRGPVARDLPDALGRRLYLREQLLLRVGGVQGEVEYHGLEELAHDPDRGARDEERGEDDADARLEVERGERREGRGEARRLRPEVADDRLHEDHEGEGGRERERRLEGEPEHVVAERAGGGDVGTPPARGA